MELHPLTRIAIIYHDNCEEYDRAVCTGFGRDGALSINGSERAYIDRNARSELQRAIKDAEREGYSSRQVMDEIRNVMMNGDYDMYSKLPKLTPRQRY